MSQNYLIDIAKDAIKEELLKTSLINKEKLLKEYPQLGKNKAAFVTLEKMGHLRGCIGSIIAHRTLLEDLVNNAKAAAFNDPRFPPLTKEEFENEALSIEISLLSEPKRLNYDDIDDLKQKIRPGIDGVILKYGTYQATYLPQVWEQLSDFDQFFSTLCQKAGLEGGCLALHPDIFVYQAQKIKNQ